MPGPWRSFVYTVVLMILSPLHCILDREMEWNKSEDGDRDSLRKEVAKGLGKEINRGKEIVGR